MISHLFLRDPSICWLATSLRDQNSRNTLRSSHFVVRCAGRSPYSLTLIECTQRELQESTLTSNRSSGWMRYLRYPFVEAAKKRKRRNYSNKRRPNQSNCASSDLNRKVLQMISRCLTYYITINLNEVFLVQKMLHWLLLA